MKGSKREMASVKSRKGPDPPGNQLDADAAPVHTDAAASSEIQHAERLDPGLAVALGRSLGWRHQLIALCTLDGSERH